MPEETVLKEVLGLASPSTSHGSKHNKVADKMSDASDRYLLKHVKHDFYKKRPGQLVLVVYVKEIDQESLQVNFDVKALRLKFRTRCKEFLKLHNQVSEETIFEWNIKLRHELDSRNCKYVLGQKKLTLNLTGACVKDQWSSLEDLMMKEVVHGPETNGVNTFGTKTKGDDGDVIFEHCNGVNFSNDTQTRVNAKNSLGIEISGVPSSLTDDEDDAEKICNQSSENVREQKSLNCTNSKGCGVEKLEDRSNGVLCNEIGITENKDADNCTHDGENEGTNTKCSNRPSKQENIVSKDLSDPNTAKTNNTLDSDKSSEKTNMAEQTKDYRLCYDVKKHICVPGSAGLANPANLCYINSVVQCLSSVIELRMYLLAKKHLHHINSENKNGYGGELISTFDNVIKGLWSGKERAVSASKLKFILGKKHKQFMHYGQGDAQEFLTFLADGLHEDLKEEKKKTLTEIKDDDSKDISESSRMHWEKYVNGNTSIISDLFQGQSVSEIRCQDCTKPSTAFDYWMQLNLPIPEDPKYISVYVFFLNPKKEPLQTKLKVYQRTICSELVAQLCDIVDVPAHRLLLLRSYYNRISHIYDPCEWVTLSSDKEILIAYEILFPTPDVPSSIAKEENENVNGTENVDNPSNNCTLHISVIQRMTHRVTEKCSKCGLEKPRLSYCSKCCKVAYCNRECQSGDWKRHRQYCNFQPSTIGTPFVISINASQATLDNLKAKALDYARFSVAPRKGNIESSKFNLTLLENLTDYHSKGQILKNKGDTPVVDENVCLALDWDATTQENKIISKDLVCEIHDSVNADHSTEDNSCSLKECLKLYWNPENINKDCGWRCDNCKEARAATRKMTICKHPQYLVIHLKRFSYSGNGRKIDKDIRFPLRGLDMSSFTHPDIPRDEAIYDLRGVCSHYGYMNFGHYIAFCKPYSEEELDKFGLRNGEGWLRYDDNKVSTAEERNVEQTQAYILFYRRRENNTTSCVPKRTSEVNCNGTKEDSTTDPSDPQYTHDSVETSDVESEQEQNDAANNIEIKDFLANKQGGTLHHSTSTDHCSMNDEVLLEDRLD